MNLAVRQAVESLQIAIEMELGYNAISPETHKDFFHIGDAEKALMFRLEQTGDGYFALEVFAEGFIGGKLIFRIAGERNSEHVLPGGVRCRLATMQCAALITCVFLRR